MSVIIDQYMSDWEMFSLGGGGGDVIVIYLDDLWLNILKADYKVEVIVYLPTQLLTITN
jgi:hypothetical protein